MDEIEKLLCKKGFSEDVVKVFKTNKIDREVFIDLDKDDMRELGITALGNRKKLMKVIAELKHDVVDFRVGAELEVSVLDDQLETMDDETSSEHLSEMIDSESIDDTEQCSVFPVVEEKPSVSSVPDRLAGWEEDFVIPTQYSDMTMHCLNSGKLTSKSRTEIVQNVATKMLNYCKYPSHLQYETVGRKIVKDLLKGKCADYKGSGHDSWTNGLKTKFKNIRRKPRLHTSGLEFIPPPRKKCKIEVANCHGKALQEDGIIQDEESYKRHLSQLQRENLKPAKNLATIRSLMKETAVNRRRWILEKSPHVDEVIAMFPALQDYNMLVEEFSEIEALKEFPEELVKKNWIKFGPKIIHQAKLESQSRPVLAQLIASLDLTNESNARERMYSSDGHSATSSST